jgi:hypothetical protein
MDHPQRSAPTAICRERFPRPRWTITARTGTITAMALFRRTSQLQKAAREAFRRNDRVYQAVIHLGPDVDLNKTLDEIASEGWEPVSHAMLYDDGAGVATYLFRRIEQTA